MPHLCMLGSLFPKPNNPKAFHLLKVGGSRAGKRARFILDLK
jgi:hypothetical protein